MNGANLDAGVNWDAIGAIAELLGAIAVVATLAYLATQIRNNTRSSVASTNHSIARSRNELNLALANDPEFARLIAQAAIDIETMERADQLRVSTYWTAMFNTFEDIYIQQKKGFADEGQHEAMVRFFVDFLRRSKGLCYWWSRNKHSWTEGFQAEVDELI